MAAGYVQLPADGAGKKVQTFENSVSGNTVHANGVVLVQADGTTLDASSATDGLPILGTVANNAADGGNPVKVGGVYNSTLPTLDSGDRGDFQQDARGRLIVSAIPGDGTRMTYRACASITTAASATDIFEMNGSATKTVYVKKVRFHAAHSSLVQVPVALVRRSTQDSGGTASNATKVPIDSANDASTVGTMRVFTANPSGLGTEVGNVGLGVTNAFTSAITNQGIEFVFGDNRGQELTLRGTSQWLYLNVGTTTFTTAYVEVEWSEA